MSQPNVALMQRRIRALREQVAKYRPSVAPPANDREAAADRIQTLRGLAGDLLHKGGGWKGQARVPAGSSKGGQFTSGGGGGAGSGLAGLAATFDDLAAIDPPARAALGRMRDHFTGNTRRARQQYGEPAPITAAEPQALLDAVTARARAVPVTRQDFGRRQEAGSDAERLAIAREAAVHVLATHHDAPMAVYLPDLGDIEFRYGRPGNPEARYSGGYGLSHGVVKRFAEGRNGVAELDKAMEALVFGTTMSRLDAKTVIRERGGLQVVLERVPDRSRRYVATFHGPYPAV